MEAGGFNGMLTGQTAASLLALGNEALLAVEASRDVPRQLHEQTKQARKYNHNAPADGASSLPKVDWLKANAKQADVVKYLVRSVRLAICDSAWMCAGGWVSGRGCVGVFARARMCEIVGVAPSHTHTFPHVSIATN